MARIRAGIGPAIGAISYEVGPEFPAPFLAERRPMPAISRWHPAAGHFLFDLGSYVEDKLRRLGVTGSSVPAATPRRRRIASLSYRRKCLRPSRPSATCFRRSPSRLRRHQCHRGAGRSSSRFGWGIAGRAFAAFHWLGCPGLRARHRRLDRTRRRARHLRGASRIMRRIGVRFDRLDGGRDPVLRVPRSKRRGHARDTGVCKARSAWAASTGRCARNFRGILSRRREPRSGRAGRTLGHRHF